MTYNASTAVGLYGPDSYYPDLNFPGGSSSDSNSNSAFTPSDSPVYTGDNPAYEGMNSDLFGDGSAGLGGDYSDSSSNFNLSSPGSGNYFGSDYSPFGSYGGSAYPTGGYYGSNSNMVDSSTQDLIDQWNKKTPGEKTWASVYGKTGSEGLANFSKGWNDITSPLQKYVNNPVISTLMSMNPISAIAKAAINGPGGVGGMGGSMLGGALSGSPVGALVGGLAGSTAGNYFMGSGDSMPSNSQLGGGLGSMLGYYSGNPYGSTIGGFLGSQAGANMSNTGSPYGQTNGMGMGNPTTSNMYNNTGFGQPNMQATDNNSGLLGGLAAMYASGGANKAYNSQINNLNSLFAPNSPYAQQMQQTLDRRDAASGRRSQYGTRAVELQAALAQQAAKSAPQLQSLNNQKIQTNNMLLATLMNNKGVGNLFNSGISDLKGLFNSQPQQTAQASPFTGLDNAYSNMNPNLGGNYLGGDNNYFGG